MVIMLVVKIIGGGGDDGGRDRVVRVVVVKANAMVSPSMERLQHLQTPLGHCMRSVSGFYCSRGLLTLKAIFGRGIR